jgi:hypothetical protein
MPRLRRLLGAIHALSLMSSKSGAINRINHWIFKSRSRARLLYPVLRPARNLLLKALRKTKINNSRLVGNDWF